MISESQKQALLSAKAAAVAAGHKWPGCAAVEAMVETGWLVHTPPKSNNVLGIKAFHGWAGKVVGANGTEESPDGTWSGPQKDKWCVFPTMADCFAEQMKILQEPRYAKALVAQTPEEYIVEECRVWSTGLEKGQQVLSIYHSHLDLLG